ncbi:hypothetical protein [Duganella sp. LjRoot269]|jgi:spermidine synthase|uniref:hypothetical protein n=1 Tax=Duganella sp. LjRoot269 TaxID=3342305 RepID=UPI003ED02AD4
MSLPESSNAAYITPYLAMLPPNARLLIQAGGTDGGLARQYRARYPAASWLAVDADATLAQQAREYADRVHQADLHQAGEVFYKHLEWADGWVFDCTLEHLRDPGKVLAQVRKVIQYDACVVARIANSEHWNQTAEPARHRLALAGVLGLFEDAGFRVVNGIMLNPAPVPEHVVEALRQRAARTGETAMRLLEEAQPSHYLIKAMPA